MFSAVVVLHTGWNRSGHCGGVDIESQLLGLPISIGSLEPVIKRVVHAKTVARNAVTGCACLENKIVHCCIALVMLLVSVR